MLTRLTAVGYGLPITRHSQYAWVRPAQDRASTLSLWWSHSQSNQNLFFYIGCTFEPATLYLEVNTRKYCKSDSCHEGALSGKRTYLLFVSTALFAFEAIYDTLFIGVRILRGFNLSQFAILKAERSFKRRTEGCRHD
jgi:hypothetical protein